MRTFRLCGFAFEMAVLSMTDVFANHHDFMRRKAEHADREAKAKGHDAATKERIASEQKRREELQGQRHVTGPTLIGRHDEQGRSHHRQIHDFLLHARLGDGR